jgi:hypothetical protein
MSRLYFTPVKQAGRRAFSTGRLEAERADTKTNCQPRPAPYFIRSVFRYPLVIGYRLDVADLFGVNGRSFPAAHFPILDSLH